ncbi:MULTISPECIES: hypothetical protein [unclassified Plantactinospora]|nr:MULTISPECIES: hypothetical protein [unclassified Plantactinospora]
MQFALIGLPVATQDPAASAAWFAERFGFKVGVDLRWYCRGP